MCKDELRWLIPHSCCRFAKVALQRLMETVQKGDDMYHGVVLDILKTIFEVGKTSPESYSKICKSMKEAQKSQKLTKALTAKTSKRIMRLCDTCCASCQIKRFASK